MLIASLRASPCPFSPTCVGVPSSCGEPGEDSVGAGGGRLQGVVVGKRGEDDLGGLCHLAWRVAPAQAGLLEGAGVFALALVAVDLITSRVEAGCHVAAHVAETDEADGRHRWPSSLFQSRPLPCSRRPITRNGGHRRAVQRGLAGCERHPEASRTAPGRAAANLDSGARWRVLAHVPDPPRQRGRDGWQPSGSGSERSSPRNREPIGLRESGRVRVRKGLACAGHAVRCD